MDINEYASLMLQQRIAAKSEGPLRDVIIQEMKDEAEDKADARDERRLVFLDELNRRLSAAKEDGSDAHYVDGLRRLVDKYTGKLQK